MMDNPIYRVYRDNKAVRIQVDTNLETCSELRSFNCQFENQESVECIP